MNCMANSALPRVIPDIPLRCTAFIASLVIPVLPLPQTPAPNPAWNQMTDKCQMCSDSQLCWLRTSYTVIERTVYIPLYGQSNFLKCALSYFGYQFDMFQTDNGANLHTFGKQDMYIRSKFCVFS